MATKQKRPVFLNLFQMKFPPTAIVSILHRITGVVLFLGLPFLLYILQQSTCSFDRFITIFPLNVGFKFLMWVIGSSALYHLCAGIRHLVMDMGWGESLSQARVTAYVMLVLLVLIIIGMGVWLW